MYQAKGDIWSEGSLIDLGNGHWKCRYSRTEDGKRHQVTRSFRAS